MSAVLALCLAAGLLGACSNDDSGGKTGTAGSSTPGGAGSTGAAGTVPGTAGTSATAGTSGGAAGTTATAGTGAAGTSATGGTTGGTAGTAGGGAGAAGATGTAGGGGLPGAVKTEGCGMAPAQPLMTYTKYTIMVGANPRDYWIWLPAGYDPSKAYPTVFIGPGCGGRGNQGIPMMMASGDKAILIGLDASPKVTGRDCFMTESPTSPEIPYFDATLAAVEAKLCMDKSRLFLEGFSAGSWLSNLLGCARGNILKAQGNASGCTPPLPTCTGPIPMMAVHDMGDGNNSYSCGVSNRDRLVKLNGCAAWSEAVPYDPGPMVKAPAGKTISCLQAKNCMPGKPVIFCSTTGLGHNDGSVTGASTYGFWDFWMSLP